MCIASASCVRPIQIFIIIINHFMQVLRKVLTIDNICEQCKLAISSHSHAYTFWVRLIQVDRF